MKIYVKRMVSGVTSTTPTLANFNATPTSVLSCVADHPLDLPPVAPVMADYIALGATGGVNTNTPNAGIRFARNGNYVPIKLNYFRNTVAAQSVIRYKTGIRHTLKVDQLYPNWNDDCIPGVGIGSVKKLPISIPTGPPLQTGGVNTRDVMFPSKLNVTPGASSDVEYESTSLANASSWTLAGTTNGFPAASNYLARVDAVDSAMVNLGVYNITAFLASGMVQGIVNPVDQVYAIQGASCEYYEMDIDDSLIANIASLTNDVFIIIPMTFGQHYNTQNTLPGGQVMTIDGQDNINGFTSTLAEFVIPLSYLLAQSAVTPTLSGQLAQNDVVSMHGDAITGGAYAIDATFKYTISLQPFNEITLLDPQLSLPATPVGPF